MSLIATKKLFLFDFDGTLADTSLGILASTNHVRAHYGLSPLNFDQVKIYIGIGLRYLVKGCLSEKPEIDVEEASEIYKQHHNLHLCDQVKFYPGVVHILKTLKAKDKKLGIVSNKSSLFMKKILEYLQCPVEFELIYGADNSPARKPDPQIIRHCAHELNCSLAETVMIGDSQFDIQAGKAAGAATVACLWGFHASQDLLQENPDFKIKTAAELLLL